MWISLFERVLLISSWSCKSWGLSVAWMVALGILFAQGSEANSTLPSVAATSDDTSQVASTTDFVAREDDVEGYNLTAVTGYGCGGAVGSASCPQIVPWLYMNDVLKCQPYHGIYVNHVYFQLANAFFLLSHLATTGILGVLYLRFTLLIGCSFLFLWGWTVACWLDAALWNVLFVVINFLHVCTLLYKLRPIKFSREIDEVYTAVFKPLRVSRHQFRKILMCMKSIKQLKYQQVYAQEKVTKVDSLSLVLSGKLVVSQGGRALHIVFPHQFLDSPEWFGVSTDEFFQVSITAMEESRVLLWHRDKLKLSIIGDQFLQAVFDHILGRDVVKKLMQVSETMSACNIHQNGQVVRFNGVSEHDPDQKLFIIKKNGDGQGITALISRQLHAPGDLNNWRLGRIDEADHETPV